MVLLGANLLPLAECTYFRIGNDFYLQEKGLPVSSDLLPVVANIYMESFKDFAIETSTVKSKLWLRCVDNTFITWNRENKNVEGLLHHINYIHRKIRFTMEEETQRTMPFLNVKVTRKNKLPCTKSPPTPNRTFSLTIQDSLFINFFSFSYK